MGKSKSKKLLKRLDRLERVVRKHDDRERRRRAEQRASRDAGACVRAGAEAGGGFEEKRVIDTIVRLVVERVARVVQRENQIQSRRDDRGGGDRGRDESQQRDERSERDHGDRRDGEKRVVDLIVGLVTEHVGEIVSSEFDRRIGPPRPDRDVDPEVLPPEDAGTADEE